jgi:fucose 4-O-acetylase-like acetyltransferase
MNDTKANMDHQAERYEWVDYDRGISIILVSFRHTFESLYNSGLRMYEYPWIEYMNVFLFGFRMPLFFIASGMFLSGSLEKKGLDGYNKSRLKTILYPMMIWSLIQLTLQIMMNGQTNISYEPSDYISLIFDPRETGQFWYLNALFFVGALYAILKVKMNISSPKQLLVGLVMYGTVAILRSEGLYLGFVMDILQFYLFFAIGDNVSAMLKNKNNFNTYASPFILLLLIPLFILIQYNFTEINIAMKSNYYVEHNMPLFYLTVALVGCALSMNISFILAKLKQLKFLTTIGYHSIHIYCMQIIAMAGTRMILLKYFKINDVPLLTSLILCAGILLPILAYKMLISMNAWWLFTLQKPSLPIKQPV